MTSSRTIQWLLFMGFLSAVGCRATPAPDSGFLQDSKLMRADKSVPFNRVWQNPKYRDREYSELYVASVNTDYIMAENIWEKASSANLSKDSVKKNVSLLADYQRSAISSAIWKDPHKKLKIVDKPGPHTLVLEMALVQLVPSKPELQAASYVTWIATPVMIGASAASGSQDEGKGVIAMEARTRDGATGDVVTMFADRQRPPFAVVDIKALFWWESAKPICDGWARQFVAMETNPKGTKIEEIPAFQLLVW